MARVELRGISKLFPGGAEAVRDLSLTIEEGEILVLVGPSGSGKSTVLRMIAGLEAPSSGRILFDGEDVTERPPQERAVAMVFQSYALYPHMTVRDNIGFGLRVRGRPREEIARRVAEAAQALGLEALLDRRPAQLSGGQRQRVALGRAIVRNPRVFLLDEPLSNLDAQLRAGTRAELARLHRRLGVTMAYVTHDQVEAMSLGRRVAVLRGGVLQQLAPPGTLYHEPANAFVAGFIGSPPMNLIAGGLHRENETVHFRGGGLDVAIPEPAEDTPADVLFGIRPHDVVLAEHDGAPRLPVTLVEPLGSEDVVHLALPEGGELLAVRRAVPGAHLDAVLPVVIEAGAVHLFRAGDGSRVALRARSSR